MSVHPDYPKLEEHLKDVFQSVSKYKTDQGGILDSKFESQVKSMPWQSLLELKLAMYLIDLNLDIYSANEGPDFQLKKLSGNDSIWLEAVCPTNGNDTPNKDVQVEQKSRTCMISASLRDPDYERRLTGVLAEKARKYSGYLDRGIVAPSDDCLIVVSTDQINTHHLPFEHQRFSSVLFNESPVIEINRHGYGRRQEMSLATKKGEPISCRFFEDNSFISGVVYKERGDFIYFSPEYRTGISLKDWIISRGVESLSNSLSGEIELEGAGVVEENDVVNRLLKQMDFGVKFRPRQESIPEGSFGYIRLSGTFGSDGGTFVSIPKAVQALTKITSADGIYGEIAGNAMTENVLSGTVEIVTNNIIPLGVLNKICTAVFGKKTPIKSRNAVLLTSIHQAKNKTLDGIMNEQAKRFAFLEQSTMDEQEFGESLRYLESIGVVKCEGQHIALLDTIVQH